MASLVVFELSVGRSVRIRSVVHEIVSAPRNTPALVLQRGSDEESKITITRSELATLVVLEEAEFVDELEDPLPGLQREVTNLSLLPVFRIHDWFTLIFMFRRMVHVSGYSPRSPVFMAAYAQTLRTLKAYRRLCGVAGGKIYAPWTLYNCTRRWRANRYSLSSLQKRGLEYSPWREREPRMLEADRFTKEYWEAQPNASIADAHEATNKHLKEWASRRTKQPPSSTSKV
jgi:hypothetical protein